MSDKTSIKAVLTGGGTGGHIYPAVAVGQALKNDSEIEALYYIGCSKNIEKDIIAAEGIDFYSINVSGMPRKISFKFISWFVELLAATFKSAYLLKQLQPDVVFGTGGYVTAPVLMACQILMIPFVVHDPDAHPGMVNRFMARDARCVSVAFEQAKEYFKKNKYNNIKFYGNPVRASLTSTGRAEAIQRLGLDQDKKTIFAMGGSQGAKTINEAVKAAAPELINQGYQVVHQTGKKNYDEFIGNLNYEHPAYIVKPYFEDMSVPLNAADVAISRAGSLSISELNLCGLPSILVPYPYAAADHQRFNAQAMQEAGAGFYLDDSDCTVEKIVELINLIFENLENMEQANLALAKPDAVNNIVAEIKKAGGIYY